MQPFPHHYSVVAKADTQGDVDLGGRAASADSVCAANRVRRTWRPMVSRNLVRRRRCGLLRVDLSRHRRAVAVRLGVARVQRDRNRRPRRPRDAVHGARGPCASHGAIRRERGTGATAARKSRGDMPGHEFLQSSTPPGIHRGDSAAVKTIIFACVHNAGRSQMAAAFFNKAGRPCQGAGPLRRNNSRRSGVPRSGRGDAGGRDRPERCPPSEAHY